MHDESLVARMSEATSGTGLAFVPGYRCASSGLQFCGDCPQMQRAFADSARIGSD
jgi:hypothetical protein